MVNEIMRIPSDKKINPPADRKVFLTACYRNICALSIDFMPNTHKNKPGSVYSGPQVGTPPGFSPRRIRLGAERGGEAEPGVLGVLLPRMRRSNMR
jgi:hypothetical protein